jgi:hypothetical protein
MTIKTIYTFHRNGEPVAELHLELRREDSVRAWSWHGDPAIKKLIRPLPKNDQHGHDTWYVRIDNAAQRAGLTFTMRHEGHEHLLLPGSLKEGWDK